MLMLCELPTFVHLPDGRCVHVSFYAPVPPRHPQAEQWLDEMVRRTVGLLQEGLQGETQIT